MDEVRIVTEVDRAVREQVLAVRDTGLVNMFDVRGVGEVAEAMGFTELAGLLREDTAGYVRLVLRGE